MIWASLLVAVGLIGQCVNAQLFDARIMIPQDKKMSYQFNEKHGAQVPYQMPTWDNEDDSSSVEPIAKGPLVSDMLQIDRSCRIFADLARSQAEIVKPL
jgi:hypothetical protein